MSVGSREQPEKEMDVKYRPKSHKRKSRKEIKQAINRRDRHEAKIKPEEPRVRPKYRGYEW